MNWALFYQKEPKVSSGSFDSGSFDMEVLKIILLIGEDLWG